MLPSRCISVKDNQQSYCINKRMYSFQAVFLKSRACLADVDIQFHIWPPVNHYTLPRKLCTVIPVTTKVILAGLWRRLQEVMSQKKLNNRLRTHWQVYKIINIDVLVEDGSWKCHSHPHEDCKFCSHFALLLVTLGNVTWLNMHMNGASIIIFVNSSKAFVRIGLALIWLWIFRRLVMTACLQWKKVPVQLELLIADIISLQILTFHDLERPRYSVL